MQGEKLDNSGDLKESIQATIGRTGKVDKSMLKQLKLVSMRTGTTDL